ncbi:MAG: hypothetical protein R3F43_05890 [bacterium]
MTVRPVEHDRYRDAVLAELAARAPAFAGRDPALSVYFGGGTPGLWSPAAVGAVIDGIAHPRPGGRRRGDGGVQPRGRRGPPPRRPAGGGRQPHQPGHPVLRRRDAGLPGRRHDAATNRQAAAAVHAAGFTPEPRSHAWQPGSAGAEAAVADVRRRRRWDRPALSAYQLTVEAGTPFQARAARRGPAGPRGAARRGLRGRARGGAQGGAALWISDFARPGHEAVHNSLYWTFGGVPGPGSRRPWLSPPARWHRRAMGRTRGRWRPGSRAPRPGDQPKASGRWTPTPSPKIAS